MPKTKQTINEKLIKCRISRERYDDEIGSLLAAQFTRQQAEEVIVRRASGKTVQSVLSNYAALLNEPYELSREQIVAIASNNGGAQAMKIVLESYESLQGLGFIKEQIVAMASNVGGAQAMRTVLESYESLQGLGFRNEQIAAMASNRGGAQAIRTVLESYQSLQGLGFIKEQIVAMASIYDGAQAMRTVLESCQSLQGLGFRNEQIVAIASNGGGVQAMKSVIRYYTELSSYGYSLERITSLAARTGGARKIKMTNAREFATFVREYLLLLLPDATSLNPGLESDDMDFLSRSFVDYETWTQLGTQKTIHQPQINDCDVQEKESSKMVGEDEKDVISIAGNNFQCPEEEMDEDGLIYFDDCFDTASLLQSKINSPALKTLGVFSIQLSGNKRARTEENDMADSPFLTESKSRRLGN